MKKEPKLRSDILVEITIKLESDGLYTVTRMRKDNGESASGLRSLEECFEYIRAHEIHKLKTDQAA